MKNAYGVVTYSKDRGESRYFVRLHDTWKKKFGGRVHIDIGFVDEKCRDGPDALDTIHLMLNKNYSPDFVDFVKKMRGIRERD